MGLLNSDVSQMNVIHRVFKRFLRQTSASQTFSQTNTMSAFDGFDTRGHFSFP